MQIQGNIGILTLGKKLLQENPRIELFFDINPKFKNKVETELFEKSIKNILTTKTKFGRISIVIDRRSFDVRTHLSQLKKDNTNYNPADKKRAEKKPTIVPIITQCLKNIAEEGLSDSVEFRRLARRYIRKAKSHNADTLLFTDLIFGEKRTKKILQHIAGTQLKVFTLDDFFIADTTKSEKQVIEIAYNHEELTFLKKRSEAILQQKLSQKSFRKSIDKKTSC